MNENVVVGIGVEVFEDFITVFLHVFHTSKGRAEPCSRGPVGMHTSRGGSTMDHTNHTRLDQSELTEAVLDGATVYGPGDENVGSVSHTHGMGASCEVVIDVG